MDLITQAFKELFPDREIKKTVSIKYSGRFKSFNANVKYTQFKMEFQLSKDWRGVSRDIQIGLIQSLLAKMYKTSNHTSNMDLYDSFVRNLSRFAPKTLSDPILDQSFVRVNNKYFYGLLDKPNLKWGQFATYKLGSYEYQSDTVIISKLFQLKRNEVLDYIMYHELLHKKHKYKSKNGRSYHHTPEFRKAEKKFENQVLIEKELSSLCRKAKFKKVFSSWF